MEFNFPYKTISDIAKSGNYPFTIHQLRFFIHNREKNGLETALRKIGKKWYVRMDLFNEWIESQKG